MGYSELIDELKPMEIPLRKIYLDPNNPRFTGANWDYVSDKEVVMPEVQEATRRRLIKEWGVDKLRMNMEVNGYLPIDRVVVREIARDSYVVLEGNRRICAAKMISEVTSQGEDVQKRILESLKIIPCLVYTGRNPCLGKLPPADYDTSIKVFRKVYKDCQLSYNGNRYKVPYHVIGKKVMLKVKGQFRGSLPLLPVHLVSV